MSKPPADTSNRRNAPNGEGATLSGPAPAPVADAAEAARQYVHEAIGFEVDGTSETLPVVDHYLTHVPEEQASIRELIAGAIGCYFGEVIRGKFEAEWQIVGDDLRAWRLTLPAYAVHFYPVGIAGQSIPSGRGDEAYDDTIYIEGPEREYVEQSLASSPQISEKEYYSLSGRYDSVCTIVDLIVRARAIIAEKQEQTN